MGLCEVAADVVHESLDLDPEPIEMVRPTPVAGNSSLVTTGAPEKRLFGVIPNYRAEQKQPVYTPLTTGQKFAIAKSDSFDLPNYFLLAGYAMQSQMALDGFSHKSWATGFAGFYARSVSDQIIGSYVTEAILPSLLHEDPRFFRQGTGSFFQRSSHALASILITKHDNGRATFNFSEILGNAGTVAITSSYYPQTRTAGESAERLGMALGNDVVSNLITEFWPDIKRHFSRQKLFGAKR